MDFLTDDISHVIQLSVAPVFLLAAISQALNVLSTRLGRIIDRGRRLNELKESGVAPHSHVDSGQDMEDEQYVLAKRARLINRAIALCTFSALFVTLVIVFLFVDALAQLRIAPFIASLFTVALLCLITALIIFLQEIGLSIRTFRFGPYRTNRQGRPPQS